MQKPRVLLISDNDDERELYESGLAIHEFDVRTVAAIEELPAAIEEHQPHMLLLNLRLGDQAVWARLEEVRFGAALGLPGVLLTGSVRGDAANRMRAHMAGCAAFIAKPCMPDDLAAVLRAVLAGQRDLIVMDASTFVQRAPAPPQPGS